MNWILLLLLLCGAAVPLQVQTETTTVSPRPQVVNIGSVFTFKSLIGKVIRVAMQAAVDDVNANPSVLNNTLLNIIMHDTKFNGFMSIMERKSTLSSSMFLNNHYLLLLL